jgi:hypothetical protein
MIAAAAAAATLRGRMHTLGNGEQGPTNGHSRSERERERERECVRPMHREIAAAKDGSRGGW